MEGFFFTTSHPQPLRRRPWKPLPDQWRQNNPRWKIPRHRHLAGRFLFFRCSEDGWKWGGVEEDIPGRKKGLGGKKGGKNLIRFKSDWDWSIISDPFFLNTCCSYVFDILLHEITEWPLNQGPEIYTPCWKIRVWNVLVFASQVKIRVQGLFLVGLLQVKVLRLSNKKNPTNLRFKLINWKK